jgi:tRNA A37 threonylcarbamoyltransferase TsaD
MILLVSGGHTKILDMQNGYQNITELATTIDDSFGESFDKVLYWDTHRGKSGKNYPKKSRK